MKHYEYLFENADTSILDLTQKMVRVVQSGDLYRAEQFVRSDIYLSFQKKIRNIPEYVTTSYIYNCVAAYVSAAGAVSSYSGIASLLEIVLKRKCRTPEDYLQAMSWVIVEFTKLVHDDKREPSGSLYTQRACDYISDHLYSRISPEELASYTGCSLSYLRHRFREEQGMTLLQYIQEKKIAAAREMLLSGTCSLSETASQLGFCSESHFIKVFRKITGTTPGKYAQQRANALPSSGADTD